MLPDDAIAPPEPVEIPGSEGLHPNDTWPTPSGLTLDSATLSCETPIRNLPIFPICDEYTAETRQAITDSCVLDIQVCLRDLLQEHNLQIIFRCCYHYYLGQSAVLSMNKVLIISYCWLVAWYSGRTSVFDRRMFPCPTRDHLRG